MITYKKRILKPTTTILSSTLSRLHDFQTPYSYCGLAPLGSTQSQNVWEITRIEVFMDGTVNTQIATSVSWDDRYTAVYS